jgi:hypothetical protein
MKKLLALLLLVIFVGCRENRISHKPIYSDAYEATVGVFPKQYIFSTLSPGSGTGVLLDTGFILTAKHVVDTNDDGFIDQWEKQVQVKFYSPIASVHTATVVSDPLTIWKYRGDFAFLAIENPPESKIRLINDEDYKQIKFGDKLFAIGRSNAELPHLTLGVRSTDTMDRLHRASLPIYYGNSGGGVFSSETGELVGIAAEISLGDWDRNYEVVPSWSMYVPATMIREHANGLGLPNLTDIQMGLPFWRVVCLHILWMLNGIYFGWLTYSLLSARRARRAAK